ncbi:MAG TPA: hypothetical protein P5318_04040 [Candidatus Hydrogenedentes bacterium]|nr:hypothetical protein [Candidatus Hydrogenedentota bacterium]HRT19275.1 hypothetical protein [Candidatus Hydrogenedentota bacterium]HRT63355.1 hypothetical protein [Candidatus Hydrogenedentota bacterium]
MLSFILLGLALNAAESPGLIINEDDSHFFGSRTADQMTREGLIAFVDQYAGTKVSHLFLCPNAMKASFASKVFDPIWHVDGREIPDNEPFARRWIENARLLDERGLDPYAIWIARCREKGISPWLSMRMNDVHNVDNVNSYIHGSFWVEHPEYWRVPGSTGSWVDRAFDYAIPEVRDHHMRFIRELLDRYDPDGLELDWMRFGYHFKPGHEAEGREILNRFMRDVRDLTMRRAADLGHPIRLGARVPAHPDAARGLGMDGETWVREGLIDLLVPTPFWATTDFDIPVELWRDRLGGDARNIVLAPGGEILVRPHPGGKAIENDIESARGFAAGAWHRGADQIYLFNYMDPAPMVGGPEAYRTLLNEGLGKEAVAKRPRRHVVTYRDTVPPGMSNGAQLPRKASETPSFRIYTGPVPEKGRVTFLVGLAPLEGAADIRFDATINDIACAAMPDLESLDKYPGVVRMLQFDCPLSAMKPGYNTAAVKLTAGSGGAQLEWAEIRIVPEM